MLSTFCRRDLASLALVNFDIMKKSLFHYFSDRCLFASVAKDHVMRTWQANPPKAVMTYSQPKNGSAKKKVDSQKGKAFLSLVWVDEQNILTSSAR